MRVAAIARSPHDRSGGQFVSVIGELRMQPYAAGRCTWDAPVAVRLALAVAVLASLLVGANLATPLYPLIQQDLGLSAFHVTVAFTGYVGTLVAGLVVAGHWSDHVGRRAALVLALLLGAAGAFVFGEASSLAGLTVGRCLQGAAVALATAAGSAALRDLLPHRPDWASRLTLLASAGGVAAGPIIGGLLSLLPEPQSTPFMVQAVVLAALLIPLLALRARPAITPAPGDNPLAALKPRLPSVCSSGRRTFWTASLTGFISFAVFGFSLSLAPTYFATLAGSDSRPLMGLLAALVLGASAVVQLPPLRRAGMVSAGLLAMGSGVALVPVADQWGSVTLLAASLVLAGLGQGAAFRTAFAEMAAQVERPLYAQTVSAVYMVTYLGSTVPVLGLGAASAQFGLRPAVAWFAWAAAAGCIALAAWAVSGRTARQGS
jgi:MFS family permease